jgi:hypothetical protein
MSLELTIAVIIPLALLFGLSVYMDHRPKPLGEVHLIPYKSIGFISLIFIIILAAHLVSLWSGSPMQSHMGRGSF